MSMARRHCPATTRGGNSAHREEKTMDLGLAGKVAVITGGSVGIGLAVAEGLAAEGANLVLAARGEERLRAEAERIAAASGVRAVPVAADVGTAAGCALLADAVQQ